jgi:hypothetical protein
MTWLTVPVDEDDAIAVGDRTIARTDRAIADGVRPRPEPAVR